PSDCVRTKRNRAAKPRAPSVRPLREESITTHQSPGDPTRSFTGKAPYTAGTSLPEIAEDISDLVAINSPHETPLLDALGDPARPARSTIHEWLGDAALPHHAT